MNEFLSTDEFSIYKNEKDNTEFTIQFTTSSESLINSMIKTKQIIGSSISDDYKSLTFRASSIKSLKKYLSKRENITYDNTLKLIWSLTKQLHYLITIEHECFYEFIIENIIVVDDDKFIYISNEDLLKLSKSNKIQFTKPFNREGFISPEVFKINKIPSELNYKTIYYSLAVLAVYFLFDKNINNNDLSNEENLKPIEGTKLYGLLIRCLYEDPERRTIIYI
jgi:hypothetical protein